jgi:hypothetical protein
MWSPIKLDFLFYDFSVIFYDFFKDSVEINRKEKSKPLFCTKAYYVLKTAVEKPWLL